MRMDTKDLQIYLCLTLLYCAIIVNMPDADVLFFSSCVMFLSPELTDYFVMSENSRFLNQ